MKANELMIGDWVRMKENHDVAFQMEDVSGSDMFKRWTSDGEYMIPFSYCEIEPIPITPEILEKNGFVQNPRSKSRRSHQICTDSVYISWWRGRINILFKPFIGHSTNHVNVDVKYVHELQHALRLCGIEKEIIL